MLLNYTEICELIEQGVIENTSYGHVNSASLDIFIGPDILIERPSDEPVYLCDKTPLNMEKGTLPHLMFPGEFILAQSLEVFHLPNNISAEYKLNSSMARIGIDHANAGWCDAGWNGSVLTLELKNISNHHMIGLSPGDKIGQLIFFRHTPVPADKSYAVRGRYNGDKSVQGVKE